MSKVKRMAQKQYGRERRDINHIFNQTGKGMRALRRDSQRGYSNAMQKTRNQQQQANQHIQGTNNMLNQQTNADFARLGIGDDSTQDANHRDARFMQNLNNRDFGDDLANLRLARNTSRSAMDFLVGSNIGSRISQLGQARQGLNGAMNSAPSNGYGYNPYNNYQNYPNYQASGSSYSPSSYSQQPAGSGFTGANGAKYRLLNNLYGQ